MIWRVKRLNKKAKFFLLSISLVYWLIFVAIFVTPVNISVNFYSSYDSFIIISTIIFAFYTTTYFTVFTGKVGAMLQSSNSFADKDIQPKVNDLLHFTNYFRLGCLSIFILVLSIIFCNVFKLHYYFAQVFVGYLFVISVCFLRWIFNYITNIVTTIAHNNKI